jgi:tRNA-dihydrouridine synthase
MRLGWDERSKNGPELAARAERAGIRAITVHGRTRNQFYSGTADWRAVAAVKAATRLPVIVNGDIVDAQSARQALLLSGADAIMIGRGAYGRPWIAAALDKALSDGRAMIEPDLSTRLGIVVEHFRDSLKFHSDLHGVKIFRKHLGWYVERAPYPLSAVLRREAKARLCRLTSPREIERELISLWCGAETALAA